MDLFHHAMLSFSNCIFIGHQTGAINPKTHISPDSIAKDENVKNMFFISSLVHDEFMIPPNDVDASTTYDLPKRSGDILLKFIMEETKP